MVRLPGSHEPNNKNRSSKHLGWLTKIRPIVRCLSNEALRSFANNGNREATKELNRRDNKRQKHG